MRALLEFRDAGGSEVDVVIHIMDLINTVVEIRLKRRVLGKTGDRHG